MKTLPLLLVLLGGAIATAEPLSIETGLFEFTWGMNAAEAMKVAEQKHPEAETVGPRDLSTGILGQEIVIRKGKTKTTLRFFDGQLVEFARRVHDQLDFPASQFDEKVFVSDAASQFAAPSHVKIAGLCVPNVEGNRIKNIGVTVTATNTQLLSHLQAQRRLLAMGLRDKFITPLTKP